VAVAKMEGYSNAEIAKRLGRSLATVERTLGLIRKDLATRGGVMSEESKGPIDSLARAQQVDSICDRFEDVSHHP
jgi:transposase